MDPILDVWTALPPRKYGLVTRRQMLVGSIDMVDAERS